jgi:dipeptidyl aminopeptidase/acylaminoacyl peptidase
MNKLGCGLLLIIPGALALITLRPGDFPCGPDDETARPTASLSSLRIKTPMLTFDHRGRLLKGDLVSGEWTEISNHRFSYTPSISSSADGRWISYSGELKEGDSRQYWLYDKQTGRDRLYHQHPAWGGGIPEFSPDSKSIMLFADYDRRWPSPDSAGLYLFDAETLRSSFLGNPSTVMTPEHPGFGFAAWSNDGSEILLTLRGFPPGAEPTREHFAYRLAEKRYEPIEGEFVKGEFGDRFFRGGSRIEVYERPYIQSEVLYHKLASPDGRWIATIDRKHVLTVKTKDGSSRKVDVGRYDHCMGVTIGIHGWLDGRYLVYSNEEVPYVFDPLTGREAFLFQGQKLPDAFFW